MGSELDLGIRVKLAPSIREFVNDDDYFYWARLISEEESPYATEYSEYLRDVVINKQNRTTRRYDKYESFSASTIEDVSVIS